MKLLPRGLRARSATAYALLALVLSFTLSMGTYQLSRWYLLDQRESLATRQVMVNALVARGLVAAGSAGPDDALASLRSGSNARALLYSDGTWYSAVVDLSEAAIPQSLIDTVNESGSGRQRVVVNNVPYIAIGVELTGLDTDYYEFVRVVEYRSTLETLATVLFVGATVTTLLGAVAGWLVSRRVVRPLGDIALAAQAMSDGDLSRRLEVQQDPDLEPVARSFNEMAASLEERIARELRFTADVSHELRTPLTAMASAISLAQRVELPPRAEFAVAVLGEQVDHFRRLTLELLEISRIDAGVAELQLDEVVVEEVVRRVLDGAGVDPALLHANLRGDVIHRVDRTRFERVIANLVENADSYGGGVVSVELRRVNGDLVVVVDDAGPGVEPEERTAIFGRFHRGTVAQRPDRPKGTGLGLALVDEHIRMHGGTVEVTDRPGGGARFVVVIPRQQ